MDHLSALGLSVNVTVLEMQAEPETDEVYAQITLLPDLNVSFSTSKWL